jgi:hypothetical protein
MNSLFKSTLLAIATASTASFAIVAPQAAQAQAMPDANFDVACVVGSAEVVAQGTLQQALDWAVDAKNPTPGGCLIGGMLFKITDYSLYPTMDSTVNFSKIDNLQYSSTIGYSLGIPTNAVYEYTAEIYPYPGAQNQLGFDIFASDSASALIPPIGQVRDYTITTTPSVGSPLNLSNTSGTQFTTLNLNSSTLQAKNMVMKSQFGPTAITNAFTLKNSTSVPGPLPILGAGIAFGYSRKLRARIKSHALV